MIRYNSFKTWTKAEDIYILQNYIPHARGKGSAHVIAIHLARTVRSVRQKIYHLRRYPVSQVDIAQPIPHIAEGIALGKAVKANITKMPALVKIMWRNYARTADLT